MKKNDLQDLSLASIFAGIILIMSLVPQLGFIRFMPGVSIVLVHVPVLIGVFLLPRKYGALLGLFFGVGSLLAAVIYGAQPIDLAFINPLISVVPRILFAVGAYYIYRGLSLVEKRFKLGKTLIFGLVTLVSVVAIFFGTQALTKTFAFAKYTDKSNQYVELQDRLDESGLTPEQVNDLNDQLLAIEAELPVIFAEGEVKEAKALPYTSAAALLVIVVFITLYYHFIVHNRQRQVLYPSAFILATVLHTILVLTALVVVKPGLFADALGFQQAINIIYTIAGANGLIEALVAVFIGTPIIIALEEVKKRLRTETDHDPLI